MLSSSSTVLTVAPVPIVRVPADRVTIWSTPSSTLVPSQYTSIVFPLGTAIPEPEGVLTVTICPAPFLTIYVLLNAGQTTVPAALS